MVMDFFLDPNGQFKVFTQLKNQKETKKPTPTGSVDIMTLCSKQLVAFVMVVIVDRKMTSL